MFRMLKLALLLVFCALLVGQSIACQESPKEFSSEDLAVRECEVSEDVKTLAVETAGRLFGSKSRKSTDFTRQLVETYLHSRGKDFAIIYNTGGFGGTFIADDPEWSSVVHGIQSELAKLGYDSAVLEHTRSRYGLRGFLYESWDHVRNYSAKSPILAAKVDFLTSVNDNLKVIITGRSFGAIYSNEVMGHLRKNLSVYSIQAGHLFWYRRPPHQNALVIKDNGVMADSLNRGDLWTILRANFSHCPSTTKPPGGSMKIGPFFFRSPGHEYTWDHHGVRDRITAFLKENFSSCASVGSTQLTQ